VAALGNDRIAFRTVGGDMSCTNQSSRGQHVPKQALPRDSRARVALWRSTAPDTVRR